MPKQNISTPNPRTEHLSNLTVSRGNVQRWLDVTFGQRWAMPLGEFILEMHAMIGTRMLAYENIAKLKEADKHAVGVPGGAGRSGMVVIPDTPVPNGKG